MVHMGLNKAMVLRLIMQHATRSLLAPTHPGQFMPIRAPRADKALKTAGLALRRRH